VNRALFYGALAVVLGIFAWKLYQKACSVDPDAALPQTAPIEVPAP
jgi:hypothetical protein